MPARLPADRFFRGHRVTDGCGIATAAEAFAAAAADPAGAQAEAQAQRPAPLPPPPRRQQQRPEHVQRAGGGDARDERDLHRQPAPSATPTR
jgi:hypothetical protein